MAQDPLNPMIVAEREAIARMLRAEADSYTESGERADAEGDDRGCYASRAVAANLRRLADWIVEGEQHKI